MERRFETVFDAIAERRLRGKGFREALAASSDDELVAALAVAGTRDAVAANAIATELLNRLRRAPFLGAFLVSAVTVGLIYLLDYLYTGTFLLLDSGPRAYLLVGFSSAMALISLLLFLMWRGAFRDLRMRLVARRRGY